MATKLPNMFEDVFFFSFFVISIFHYYFSYASKMLRELGKKKKVLKRTTDTESCWNQRRKDIMYIRYAVVCNATIIWVV